ncbi:MAG: hypothetical protein KatS3mg028_0993 [Bacteroidia bacterium]|nr:MAG: hypothetical protein KatS3mg028_0993 [Bacteroidia bacterium]
MNTPITNITYTTAGATGATFSGLPAGVTGSFSSNTLTISGTPTATGTFNYTVTLTGGCGNATATGTITVTSNNTITLSSASGTDNQTVCVNTPITNITYTTAGATGATFSGLPAGVTGSFSSNTLTISGTPTAMGTFNYTIILTGGCGNVNMTGTLNVNVCTGIEETADLKTWGIYPNPNNGQFTIHGEKGSVFEISDATGRIIGKHTLQESETTLKLNVPSGVYFVREKKSGSAQKLIIK